MFVKYVYSYNNPVNYTDPTGHDPWYLDKNPDGSWRSSGQSGNKYKPSFGGGTRVLPKPTGGGGGGGGGGSGGGGSGGGGGKRGQGRNGTKSGSITSTGQSNLDAQSTPSWRDNGAMWGGEFSYTRSIVERRYGITTNASNIAELTPIVTAADAYATRIDNRPGHKYAAFRDTFGPTRITVVSADQVSNSKGQLAFGWNDGFSDGRWNIRIAANALTGNWENPGADYAQLPFDQYAGSALAAHELAHNATYALTNAGQGDLLLSEKTFGSTSALGVRAGDYDYSLNYELTADVMASWTFDRFQGSGATSASNAAETFITQNIAAIGAANTFCQQRGFCYQTIAILRRVTGV